MVAVIHRMEDGQGSLSEECLEFSPDKLCVSHETKEEKQWNDGLMSGLRKEGGRCMQISDQVFMKHRIFRYSIIYPMCML
jgi:hypothetical protein